MDTKPNAGSDTNTDTIYYVHIETTGHYWRTSFIHQLYLLPEKNGVLQPEQKYTCENEQQEFELLEQFDTIFANCCQIVTYNGTSSLLPYLTAKFKAYGLSYKLQEIPHRDLYLQYKPYQRLYQLPSMKLEDLRRWLHKEHHTPAQFLKDLTSLDQYSLILQGAYEIAEIASDQEQLILSIKLEDFVPAPIHFHGTGYYLILEENKGKILVPIYNHRLRIYYQDYHQYYYLPEEDTIIPKVLASSIQKERRQKATKETCYTYTLITANLLENIQQMHVYINGLFACDFPSH